MSYPPDVLGAVTGREAEVVGQSVADVVAVQQIGDVTGLDEGAFDGDGQRRLARRGQAGEPDGGTPLAGRIPAVVPIE